MATIKRVSLEPFDPERDTDLLRRWLHALHVARWWGNAEHVLQEALRPPVGGGAALILANDAPVGYARWEVAGWDELEAAGLHEIPEGTVDIDIAIGEPSYTGIGVATDALRLLVRGLLEEKRVPMVMMCTSTENTRAIRAFEKAGFRRARVFQDQGHGAMWLFVVECCPQRQIQLGTDSPADLPYPDGWSNVDTSGTLPG